jgi:hypothetical protein
MKILKYYKEKDDLINKKLILLKIYFNAYTIQQIRQKTQFKIKYG